MRAVAREVHWFVLWYFCSVNYKNIGFRTDTRWFDHLLTVAEFPAVDVAALVEQNRTISQISRTQRKTIIARIHKATREEKRKGIYFYKNKPKHSSYGMLQDKGRKIKTKLGIDCYQARRKIAACNWSEFQKLKQTTNRVCVLGETISGASIPES